MSIHFMYYPFRYPSLMRDGRAVPPYPLDAILPLALYPLLVYATMPKWGGVPADPPPSLSGGKPPIPPYGPPPGVPGFPPYGPPPGVPGFPPYGGGSFGGSPFAPGVQSAPPFGNPPLSPYAGGPPGGDMMGGNPFLSSLFGGGVPQLPAGSPGNNAGTSLGFPPFLW